MSKWADVANTLAGAPLGAAIGLGGSWLVVRGTSRAEREKASQADRLQKRDGVYERLIRLANSLNDSMKFVQDFTFPDLALADRIVALEPELLLYASSGVSDLAIDYADKCRAFDAVARFGSQQQPWVHGHHTLIHFDPADDSGAYRSAIAAYAALINEVRKDLRMDAVTIQSRL